MRWSSPYTHGSAGAQPTQLAQPCSQGFSPGEGHRRDLDDLEGSEPEPSALTSAVATSPNGPDTGARPLRSRAADHRRRRGHRGDHRHPGLRGPATSKSRKKREGHRADPPNPAREGRDTSIGALQGLASRTARARMAPGAGRGHPRRLPRSGPASALAFAEMRVPKSLSAACPLRTTSRSAGPDCCSSTRAGTRARASQTLTPDDGPGVLRRAIGSHLAPASVEAAVAPPLSPSMRGEQPVAAPRTAGSGASHRGQRRLAPRAIAPQGDASARLLAARLLLDGTRELHQRDAERLGDAPRSAYTR